MHGHAVWLCTQSVAMPWQVLAVVCFCCAAGAADQLTKGVFHFNRQKLLRQARMLVKRHAKFTQLLPAAEAKLAEQLQLLGNTPPESRPALVGSMREALRALAQGKPW